MLLILYLCWCLQFPYSEIFMFKVKSTWRILLIFSVDEISSFNIKGQQLTKPGLSRPRITFIVNDIDQSKLFW